LGASLVRLFHVAVLVGVTQGDSCRKVSGFQLLSSTQQELIDVVEGCKTHWTVLLLARYGLPSSWLRACFPPWCFLTGNRILIASF